MDIQPTFPSIDDLSMSHYMDFVYSPGSCDIETYSTDFETYSTDMDIFPNFSNAPSDTTSENDFFSSLIKNEPVSRPSSINGEPYEPSGDVDVGLLREGEALAALLPTDPDFVFGEFSGPDSDPDPDPDPSPPVHNAKRKTKCGSVYHYKSSSSSHRIFGVNHAVFQSFSSTGERCPPAHLLPKNRKEVRPNYTSAYRSRKTPADRTRENAIERQRREELKHCLNEVSDMVPRSIPQRQDRKLNKLDTLERILKYAKLLNKVFHADAKLTKTLRYLELKNSPE